MQRGFRRQLKRQTLLLDLLMLHRDVRWAFSAQHLHGFYETHVFNVDKIIQCRPSTDVAAFPMPDTGLAIDLEAVMRHQLVFAAGAAFLQRAGAVTAQKLNGRHPFGGRDLFFADLRQLLDAGRKLAHGFDGLPRERFAAEVPAGSRAGVNGVQ